MSNLKLKALLDYKWVIIAIFVLLTTKLLSLFPGFVEMVYSEGVFQLFRVVYDYTIGFLPFPTIYLFIGLMAFLLIRFIIRIPKQKGIKNKSLWALKSILNFASIIVILFYVFWGFNYFRQSFESKQNLQLVQLIPDSLFVEGKALLIELDQLRNELSVDTAHLTLKHLPKSYEDVWRADVESLLEELGYSTKGRVRGRLLRPKGALLRISTAGVYWPFVFEGHIDPGLYFVQWPFTMSHEMFHGYGFTDEGMCNFLAYLACEKSNNTLSNYSGKLAYWRYMAGNLRRIDKAKYKALIKNHMSLSVLNDLRQIRLMQDNYPDLFPKARNAVYDAYLKSNGVKEGLKSYSRIILLVNAWKRRKE